MLSSEEFKEVFDMHFDAIRGFVFYRCGDIEMASDVAQDVFMRLWEKRFSLNGFPIKPLLCKMANDCFVNDYRKNLRRMSFEQSVAPDEDSVYTPEDELSFSELTAAYAKALEQLPKKQRMIFLMSREDGMKYAEISDRLRISVKAVEKNVSAALRFLRKKLL
jgi:RNA polymerase sigma-70 factor (ECF subfamily)